MKEKEKNEGRPTNELEVDETQLTEEQKQEKKISAPWGVLIFCGVLFIAIIVLIIIILNL